MVGDWDVVGALLVAVVVDLERGGAELVVLCINIMYWLVDVIVVVIMVLLLYIVDFMGEAVWCVGIVMVGLLGICYTMEQLFYRDRLVCCYGFDVWVFDEVDRVEVYVVIYDELVRGVVLLVSKQWYLVIIERKVVVQS